MANATKNSSFIPYFLLFFIHSSWNFHSSRYHSLLFHPYHAHEIVSQTREHVLDPYPWDSGNEDMSTVEYCLDDGIGPFTP